MSRKLSLTVIITGCNTDNPNFQWYKDKIGERFEVVKVLVTDISGFNKPSLVRFEEEEEWYRVIDKEPTGDPDEYIHKSDCKTIEEYRNNRLEELGI